MMTLRHRGNTVRARVRHNRKGRTMNYNGQSGIPNPDMRAIKAAAKSQFGGMRGVEGIGIGDRALRVYVRSQDVADNLPREFQGVRVDFIVTGPITAYDRQEGER